LARSRCIGGKHALLLLLLLLLLRAVRYINIVTAKRADL